MSGKERCLSERQIFQYQVFEFFWGETKTETFQEAFKKFDTSTTGQVKTKLLGDILRQLSFNPTKDELQVVYLDFNYNIFFCEGFDNPSGSKCDWSVEASKPAGHYEQNRG